MTSLVRASTLIYKVLMDAREIWSGFFNGAGYADHSSPRLIILRSKICQLFAFITRWVWCERVMEGLVQDRAMIAGGNLAPHPRSCGCSKNRLENKKEAGVCQDHRARWMVCHDR